jgi:hypothetical protein
MDWLKISEFVGPVGAMAIVRVALFLKFGNGHKPLGGDAATFIADTGKHLASIDEKLASGERRMGEMAETIQNLVGTVHECVGELKRINGHSGPG